MISYGEIINILNKENKTLLRQKENIMKKIINADLCITFNEICTRENLLPIYTLNIPSDGAVTRGKRRRPSDEERKEFMKKRIKELQSTISELKTKYQQIEERWVATNIDKAVKENLDIALREILDQYRNTTLKANQKKLANLNGEGIKHQRPYKGYINLTEKILTADQ